MKKIYLLSLSLFLAFTFTKAQNAATPNAGFENWTHVTPGTGAQYDDPDNWKTGNSVTAANNYPSCIMDTASSNIHSGSAAIKLVTVTMFTYHANGLATTGTNITFTPNFGITGGIPFTARPDSMVGWYKNSPVTGDAGFIQFKLTGSGGENDTIGFARFSSPATAVSSYTRFAVPITYYNANTPVTSQWLLSSSAGFSGQVVGSTLWADDLDLQGNMIAIEEAQTRTGIRIGPNPVSGILNVQNRNSVKATLRLYDVFGKDFGSFDVSKEFSPLDISHLAAGNYICSVLDENGELLVWNKIILQ